MLVAVPNPVIPETPRLQPKGLSKRESTVNQKRRKPSNTQATTYLSEETLAKVEYRQIRKA